MKDLSKFHPLLFPPILFILCFLLRFSLISKGPFELDCLSLVLKSEQFITTGKLQYLSGAGYPLAVLLGALFIKITNLLSIRDSVFAVNLMSVCFGSATTALQYLLTKNLINEKAAIFSSIMLAFVPVLFLQSLFGISITVFLFFLLLGFYYLSMPSGINTKYYFLSGIFFGLAAATRAQDIVLMLPAIAFYVFSKEWKCSNIKKLYNLFIFVGTMALIALIFYMPCIIDTPANALGSNFNASFNYSVTRNFLGLFSKRFPTAISELIVSLTPLGFILALLGLIKLGFKNRNLVIFLCLWIAFPLFFYGNIRALCLLRYLSIIIPALIICQSAIFEHSSKNLFLMISKILAFILIITVLFYKIYPIAYCRHKNAIMPDFARWVEKHTPSNAIIISTDDALFMEYYGHRKILYRPASAYGTTKEQILQFKETLDQLLAQEVPIYISDAGLISYDTNGIFFNFINEYYESELIGEHPYELWFSGATTLDVENTSLYRLKNKVPTSNSVLKK